MSRPHVVIIGAGISGLSAAYYLQELMPEAEITVLEAASRPGGTVWTERKDGFQVEVGPNGFLDTWPSTLSLCRKLGLGDHLISASPVAEQRYLFLNEQLHRVPTSLWSLVRSPLLSRKSKLSLLLERFRSRNTPRTDESVYDFVRRRTNTEVADLFADALVTGIHAGDPKLLSMHAAFPLFYTMMGICGSATRTMKQLAKHRRMRAKALGEPYQPGGRLLTFRPGLRHLIETLQERLRKPPVFNAQVRRIGKLSSSESLWVVFGEGKDFWRADAVVLACPAHQQAGIVEGLDSELATLIGQIQYARAAVVALGYRQSDIPKTLDGFGFIAPQSTRRDILGVQWCSSIFPERAPNGMVLLRAIAGGWSRPEIVGWDDNRLLQAVANECRTAMGIEASPIFSHIIRWEKAIPQYHIGHFDRLNLISQKEQNYPGLFLAGNAYHGVALNSCIDSAAAIAWEIFEFLEVSFGGSL